MRSRPPRTPLPPSPGPRRPVEPRGDAQLAPQLAPQARDLPQLPAGSPVRAHVLALEGGDAPARGHGGVRGD